MNAIPPCIQKQVAFRAIQMYAALSYAYYDKDISLVPDHEFDMLCKWLLENYEWVKPRDLNNYLDRDMLEAGTGYNLKICGLTLEYANMLIAEHEQAMDDLV